MIKYHRRKDCSRLITGLGTGFAPFRLMKGLFCLSWVQFLLCVPRRRFGAAPGLILVLEQLVIVSRGCPEVKHCPRAFVKRGGLPHSFGGGQDGGGGRSSTARRQPQSLAAAGRHHGAAPPRGHYDKTALPINGSAAARAKTRLAGASHEAHAVGLGHRRRPGFDRQFGRLFC